MVEVLLGCLLEPFHWLSDTEKLVFRMHESTRFVNVFEVRQPQP